VAYTKTRPLRVHGESSVARIGRTSLPRRLYSTDSPSKYPFPPPKIIEAKAAQRFLAQSLNRHFRSAIVVLGSSTYCALTIIVYTQYIAKASKVICSAAGPASSGSPRKGAQEEMSHKSPPVRVSCQGMPSPHRVHPPSADTASPPIVYYKHTGRTELSIARLAYSSANNSERWRRRE
jgi:hypothetical protein